MSWLCPKSVKGMKTIQMRMKIKVKTKKNQRVSDSSKKRQRNENIPNAYENESKMEQKSTCLGFVQKASKE